MIIEPIPNELLGSSLTLIVPTETGSLETPVSNVRVERSETLGNYPGSSPSDRDIITVWADRHNSTWCEFPVGAKVRFGDELFEITEQKVYAADKPHHCRFTARKIGG